LTLALASWTSWASSPSSAAAEGPHDADPSDPSEPTSEEGPAIGWNIDGVWLTPVIGPAYTPELGLLIAAGAMLSFVADRGSPRSSFPASVG